MYQNYMNNVLEEVLAKWSPWHELSEWNGSFYHERSKASVSQILQRVHYIDFPEK